MRRITLALFAIANAGWAQVATALIFGPDDRIIVSTRPGSPYSPIGIVYLTPTGPYVTGFLVSPCRAITVKHGVAGTKGRRVQFAVGEIGNPKYWEASGGTVVEVGEAPSLEPHTGVGPGDWALIQLDRCLGKRYGFVELDATGTKPGDKITMAGYPNDKDLQLGLTLDPDCEIRGLERGMIKHDCAMQPGNSGSPLFRQSGDASHRLTVVAINSGGWSYGVMNATLSWPVAQYTSAYANQAVPVTAFALP